MSDTPRTDNAANESILAVYEESKQLERELAYARKQRDALAKAFEKIVTLVKSMPDSSLEIEIAKQSLAAVKGASHE
jgi:seryl-tRNA synthetase